ncbi:hypothetical protein [Aquimarina muelleri]|uniref:Uncharacterized protein n=1 Tax=Aquimarina muelleri TaxID=279356 RepID=A0A918JSH3_9FLAO|nr:hypothetical protein [Aquimarina muelleri]MCX2762629.1 hypothetical protein [Aquimarina muelleri]GGX05939.1 hypothetical protein GCM10007384_04550 [Aquimarina muelleri]
MKAFFTTIILLLVFNMSIGQNSIINYKLINTANKSNLQISDNQINNKLIKHDTVTTNKPIRIKSYNEKEWRKIKKQIKKSKKRFSNAKNPIHSIRKIDTVYIHTSKESLLSGW